MSSLKGPQGETPTQGLFQWCGLEMAMEMSRLRPGLGFADEGIWGVGWRLEEKGCFDHVKFEMALDHLSGAIKLEVW